MKRIFRIVLGTLAMLAVMLLSAAVTLRVALHGREVAIPNFAGMTATEASEAALNAGLDLTIENKFYSTTIPAGRMLSQAPAAGSRVRRGWQVRVTQSLGPQQVTIPDVAGEPVRQATMDIRRMSLDLGTVAHMEAPGDSDMVLAQTPPPNAGVDQPRVSLLLSSTAGGANNAVVLPSFLGMSYGTANRLGTALGLRVVYIADTPAPVPVTEAATSPQPITIQPAAGQVAAPAATPGAPIVTQTPPVVSAGAVGPITAQKPESGYRASRGETVRLTFGHSASADPNPGSASPSSAAPATRTP